MQRCNLCLILLLLLSTKLLSQDIDCNTYLSTGSQDSLSWYGIGIHRSENVDILKENAITDLVFKINAKVDASLNVEVNEKIENQKKKFFGRKNRKKQSFKQQANKSTTISSQIAISDYNFSNIEKCGNNYVIAVSLNKAVLREKTTKEALVFIDRSRILIESENSIESKLNDIDSLYEEMVQFSTRLSIIDSDAISRFNTSIDSDAMFLLKAISRFNTSLQHLKDLYKNELSTIVVEHSLTPELTHHLNRDSVLNLKITNSYQTIFDNVPVELKFADFSQSNVLDSNGTVSFTIDSEHVKNLDNISFVVRLGTNIKNHFLFQSLDLTDPVFSKTIKRKKINVFSDLSCDEDIKAFVNKDYINFMDQLKNNYQINMVDNVEDADLVIDIDCTNENIRKNSYDIYILQFHLFGKINLYGSSPSSSLESPFLNQKSFIGYKKAYANMSSDIVTFFKDFYGKIEDLLL